MKYPSMQAYNIEFDMLYFYIQYHLKNTFSMQCIIIEINNKRIVLYNNIFLICTKSDIDLKSIYILYNKLFILFQILYIEGNLS